MIMGLVKYSDLFEYYDKELFKWQSAGSKYPNLKQKECIVSIIRDSVVSDGFEDYVSARSFLFVMTPLGAFHTHRTNFKTLEEE